MNNSNPSKRGIIDPNKPGRYIIFDPKKEMDAEERAFQMWAVHPSDLDKMGLTRQEFYKLHLLAVAEQSYREAADRVVEVPPIIEANPDEFGFLVNGEATLKEAENALLLRAENIRRIMNMYIKK